MQALEHKEPQEIHKEFRLVIVGSQQSRFKTEEQEPRARGFIRDVLMSFKHDKGIIVPLIEFHETEVVDPTFHYFSGTPIVVSGGCPVGEKKKRCIDCNRQILTADGINYHKQLGHKIVETYTKGGVDSWVKIEAYRQGIQFEEHPAPAKDWNDEIVCSICGKTKKFLDKATSGVSLLCLDNKLPHKFEKVKGYKSRNLDMVQVGNFFIVINAKGSCRHCGGTGFTKIPNPKIKITATNKFSGKDITAKVNTSFHKECVFCKGTGDYSGGDFVLKEALKLGKEGYKIVI